MKKAIAVFLCLVLVTLSIPVGSFSAFSADNSAQIVNEGGSASTLAEDIEVSKTVYPSADENYFDILLTVEKKLPLTDVVMVMDISNTMNTNDRIGKAKKAAKAFLEQYSKGVGINDNSRIGMVTFNSHASVVFDLKNADENLNTFLGDIDNITAPSSESVKFTNIEAGLQLASNMLKSSSAKQKYIILITDGFPTTYIESGRDSTTEIKGYDVYRTYKNPPSGVPSAPADGLFYDFVRKLPCNGTSYSDTAAIKARTLAESIKSSGIDIYSIGIDISNESQTIQKYINVSTPIVERTSETYEVGSATDSTAYVNWLGKKIGGGPDLERAGVTNAFSRGDTDEQLETAFTTVLSLIATAEPMSVTDPMGDNVEFLGFYNKNADVTKNALSGTYSLDAENTAAYSGSITWNVGESGYTQNTEDSVTYRTFNLKYRIRLTNEADAFVDEKEYSTNGTTTLSYRTLLLEDNDPDLTVDFPIPSVKGYLADFSFGKVDSLDEPVEGAEFTLTHIIGCSVCSGDVVIDSFEATSSAYGIVEFSGIPSGHKYELAETDAPAGLICSSEVYCIEVAYGDVYVDGASMSTDFEVENVLYAAVTSPDIEGTVSLTENGTPKDFESGKFSVELTPDSSNNEKGFNLPDDATVTVDENGNFVIEGIEFIRPGEYKFTVNEVNSGNAGYDYDSGSYVIAYTVEPNDQTQTLEITNTEITKNGTPSDSLHFDNTYTTPSPVSVDIAGEVNLTGGGKSDSDITEKFFTYAVSGSDQENISGVPDKADVGAGGTLDLGTWTFDKVGVYEFTVTEDVPPVGYTDETGTVDITVTVTLDETTNELKTEVVYSSGSSLVIDNTYTYPDEISVTLEGEKTLKENGADKPIKDKQFAAVITADSSNNGDGFALGAATADISKDGKFAFENIVFKKAGTYVFTVTEENKGAAGYTYDSASYTVTYTVVINTATNTLEVESVKLEKDGETAETIAFTNVYTTPSPVSVDIAGEVNLTGGGKSDSDITEKFFTYAVSGSDQENISGVPDKADVGAGGTLDLGTWTFDKVGVYEFTVTEDVPPVGYTDETGTVDITVTVTLDETTNELKTEVVYSSGSSLVIDNTYTYPDEISVTLEGEKTLKENGADKPIKDKQFAAVITADSSNNGDGFALGAATADISKDGKFAFENIVFKKAGTYVFTVTEENKGAAGYTYDSASYTVTYTVVINTATNTLEVDKLEFEKDGEASDSIRFANVYETPAPASVDVKGITTLTGGGKTNADISTAFFSYTVTPDGEYDKVAGVPEGIVTAQGGALDFGTWVFSQVGEYSFTVSENTPPAGYSDLTGDVSITVVVTLDEDTNKLEAVATSTNGELVRIDNLYKAPDPVEVPLTGKVSLTGGHKNNSDIAADDFKFSVIADESNPTGGYTPFAGSIGVDEGGKLDFSKAQFTQEGVYKFRITQNDQGETGYTYDSSEYEVTVTVTLDKSTNTLVPQAAITLDGDVKYEIAYKNVYVPNPVSVTLGASKGIDGYPLNDAEFEFILSSDYVEYPMPVGSKDGVCAVKLTGTGDISFGEIQFTHAGVYTYTVYETQGDIWAYEYDDTVYDVTVTVTDIGGNLSAKVEIEADSQAVESIVFTNEYSLLRVDKLASSLPEIDLGSLSDIKIPEISIPELSLPELSLPGIELPDLFPSDDEKEDTAEGNTAESDTAENTQPSDIPHTGSNESLAVIMSAFLICAAGIVVTLRKKKTA